MSSQVSHPAEALDPANRVLRWLCPLIVVAAVISMLAWTWLMCPEAVTDFGRELYVPWRISQGEVLYRDLNYFNGPLSPYFNAMLFDLFGVSIRTLKLANAAIAVGIVLLIYQLVHRISDRLSATVAGIIFAVLFAAGHFGGANFNFLTPYSHDLTHGIAMSLLMIACFDQAQRRVDPKWLLLAGFAYGLVVLTKVEVTLAASLSAAVGAGTLLLSPKPLRLPRFRVALMFLLPAIAVVAAATVLLTQAMPLREALLGVAGSWIFVGDERIRQLPYFRWVIGTDQLEYNLRRAAIWTGYYALIVIPAMIASLTVRKRFDPGAKIAVAVIFALLIGLPMHISRNEIPWSGMVRPLPLFLMLMLVFQAVKIFQHSHLARATSGSPVHPTLLSLMLLVFSAALLFKILFYVRAYHYGFALSMPGTMLLIAALLGSLPRWVDRRGGEGWILRAAVLAAISVMLGMHLHITDAWAALRTYPLGTGSDRFFADVRGRLIAPAIDDLSILLQPGDTLVGFPEGAMFNYLLRVPSTSRFQNFLPSEMMMYGEQTMLDELRRRPPTYVAMIHRSATEYAAAHFGAHYGRDIARWVREEYVAFAGYGAMPFMGDEFGILLWQRRDVAPAASPPADR